MTYKKLKMPFPKEQPLEGKAHVMIGWKGRTHGLEFLCQLNEDDANMVMQLAMKLSRTVPTRNIDAVPEVVEGRERILKIMSEQLGLAILRGEEYAKEIKPESNLFADLGADDLDYIELCMALEDEFDLHHDIDPAYTSSMGGTPPKFHTVREVIDYILDADEQ